MRSLGIKTIVPGHAYWLEELDVPPGTTAWKSLGFVQRCGPGYPGNRTVQSGVTLQQLLRVCHDRVGYLHGQIPHWVNPWIRALLRGAVWLLEFRAAARRGQSYWHTPAYAITAPMCRVCGHTDCRKRHG